MLEIDGSYGEGGGQILRTSLALSLLTGKPFKIANIRARRQKPGLLNQHLTSVKTAVEVGDAIVSGDLNNSCSYNGLDVTYAVSYFKGGPPPQPCSDCPPGGLLAPPTPEQEAAPAVEPIKIPTQKAMGIIKTDN